MKINTFLQKINEMPEGKFLPIYYKPLYKRSFIFGSYSYLIAVFLHVFIVLIFASMNIVYLTIFNLFLVVVWGVCFALQRKGLFTHGNIIASLLVIGQAGICVNAIGWETGFQYYLIVPSVLTFLIPWKKRFKVSIASVYSSIYFFLFFYSYDSDPIFQLSEIQSVFLFQFNIISISIILALVAYFYYNISLNSEKRIYREHQKVVAALTERNQLLDRLNAELSEAADYVMKILPKPITTGSIRTNWRFIPSTSLGGDAFGYHRVDDDHFAVYLIDVSGHGVGAALLSASVINVLRSQSLPSTDFKDPQQVLNSLNLAFPSDNNKDMFFTIWYGVFNKNKRELTYASAGHPPAILCDGENSCECDINLLKTPNFVVGGIEGEIYVKDKCIVPEGNSLYVFSDGVYEVEQSDGTIWRLNDFVNYVKKVKNDGQSVLDRLYEYGRLIGKSDNFEDDFTIVEIVFG